MPRAEGRGKAATSASVRPAGASEGALRLMVDGLIGRIEGSELMRRSPAQCTPEDQARLVHALTALAGLRQSQQALPALTDVDLAVVEEVWPDLATLLAPAGGRGNRRALAAQQEPAESSKAASRSATRRATPVPSTPTRRSPAARAPSPAITGPAGEAVGTAAAESPDEPSAAGAPSSQVAAEAESAAEAPTPAPSTGRDLRDAVHAVLRADRRPWSGARIATQIQERDPGVTREEVYDTLYRHAELFHKTSRGWELIAR